MLITDVRLWSLPAVPYWGLLERRIGLPRLECPFHARMSRKSADAGPAAWARLALRRCHVDPQFVHSPVPASTGRKKRWRSHGVNSRSTTLRA